MLKAGNLILRNHIFSLEIKYFCKLKELLWAELSPNYVSLFVGCFDKHIRGEALIFGLNLIASRPKFTRTRSPLLRPGFLCFTQSRVGWDGAEGPQVWFLVGLSPPGALTGDRILSGCCYHQLGFSTATGRVPNLQSLCPVCSGNIFCRSCCDPLFSSKGINSSDRNSF